jgi:hypothetical protein
VEWEIKGHQMLLSCGAPEGLEVTFATACIEPEEG